MNKKIKKVEAYGIMFKSTKNLMTTTQGVQVFEGKQWAVIAREHFKLQKDADIVPVVITYPINSN